jgi:quercetin dioxygenase-like cupin family protein
MKINKNKTWIKGQTYQKRILAKNLKDKIDLIEDVIIKPHGIVPVHAHKFTDEIFYITNNKATMIVNGKEFPVGPGDFIQVFRHEEHGFRNESAKPFKLICFKMNFKKGDSYLK